MEYALVFGRQVSARCLIWTLLQRVVARPLVCLKLDTLRALYQPAIWSIMVEIAENPKVYRCSTGKICLNYYITAIDSPIVSVELAVM